MSPARKVVLWPGVSKLGKERKWNTWNWGRLGVFMLSGSEASCKSFSPDSDM